jgi:hypothetical protein
MIQHYNNIFINPLIRWSLWSTVQLYVQCTLYDENFLIAQINKSFFLISTRQSFKYRSGSWSGTGINSWSAKKSGCKLQKIMINLVRISHLINDTI